MGKNVTNPNFNLPIVCCWFGRLHVELQLGYFRLSYSPPRSCKNTEMFWRWFWLSLVTNGPFLFFQNPLFERSRSPSGFSFHSVALSTFIVSFQTPQERNMGMHETRNCTSGYFLFFFFFPFFFLQGRRGLGVSITFPLYIYSHHGLLLFISFLLLSCPALLPSPRKNPVLALLSFRVSRHTSAQ